MLHQVALPRKMWMSCEKMILKQLDYMFCLGPAVKGKGDPSQIYLGCCHSQYWKPLGCLTEFGKMNTWSLPLPSRQR